MGAHKGYAPGFVQFMGGAAHLMAPKAPIPLEDQPLTSAAGAIRATRNLCRDEEGLSKVLGCGSPAAGLRQFKQGRRGAVGAVFSMIRLGKILQPRVSVA